MWEDPELDSENSFKISEHRNLFVALNYRFVGRNINTPQNAENYSELKYNTLK
jgi:hypothetical protein